MDDRVNEQPDIRPQIDAKKIEKLEELKMQVMAQNPKILGFPVKSHEKVEKIVVPAEKYIQDKIELKTEATREEIKQKIAEFERKTKVLDMQKGKVLDFGNELLGDPDLLMERLSDVFAEYKDCLARKLQRHFTYHNLSFKNGFLHIGNLRTVIQEKDIILAINGMRQIMSEKSAEKLVIQTIVKKLRKIF